MAYPRLFQDRLGTYCVEVARNKRRSLKTKSASEAKRLFAQIKRELHAGKLAHLLRDDSRKPLGDYRDEFLAWSEANQPRATYRANRLALAKLIAAAGETITLAALNQRHLDQMITNCRKAGLKPSSINNYIRHARASLNKAVEWRYIGRNPLAGAKEIKVELKPPAYIASREDISLFLRRIEDLDARRMATAYLATGRRRAEMLALEWRNVDLEHGRYFVEHAKNHLSRWYPINSLFRAVLESIPQDQRAGRVFKRWRHPDTVGRVIKAALVAAGLGHLTLHSLRHTFASQAIMQGRTLRDVQGLLGHTVMRTTEIYAHLSDDHLSQAAEIQLGPVNLGLGRDS